MKRLLLVIIMITMALSLAACGNTAKPEADAVTVTVQNRVPDRITVLSAAWSINGRTVGTTGVEIAGEEGCLGEDSFSFPIYAEDLENVNDLRHLKITLKVTETGGGTFDAATLLLPSELGDQYELELRYEDGGYTVWQIFDNNVNARLTGNP